MSLTALAPASATTSDDDTKPFRTTGFTATDKPRDVKNLGVKAKFARLAEITNVQYERYAVSTGPIMDTRVVPRVWFTVNFPGDTRKLRHKLETMTRTMIIRFDHDGKKYKVIATNHDDYKPAIVKVRRPHRAWRDTRITSEVWVGGEVFDSSAVQEVMFGPRALLGKITNLRTKVVLETKSGRRATDKLAAVRGKSIPALKKRYR